ncbi:MAG: arginine--tRNA ligase [Polyangiaceae bacterium]
MPLPIEVLHERIERALIATFGEDLRGTDTALRKSDHADYQSNVALPLKKRLNANPREIAQKLVAALDLDGVATKVDIAGPGFINFHLDKAFLASCLGELAKDKAGVRPAANPDVVVIDYSAPNIAKEMHVGHLRSTIIGDAFARVFEYLGHRVVRQNHVGDWGTPFGMLLEHLLDLGEESRDHDLVRLVELYRDARKKFDADPDFAERSRKRVVALQAGDEQTLALWRRMIDTSKRHLGEAYHRLDITLTDADIAAESFFNDKLAPTLAELEEKGLARVDQGALCVFPPGFTSREGTPLPLIARKSDGGYGYATTDLAAIRYRLETLRATRVIYVVGAPQAQHLAMIMKTAELAGWLRPPARAEHAAFGSVLGTDGKMFRTRAGEGNVRLIDLLVEGEERALAVVADKAREREVALEESEQRAIAHAVAIAAIKYADLSSDRVKDYVFDWTRMLASEGNTGPYLQYAHARISSILERAVRLGLHEGTTEPLVVDSLIFELHLAPHSLPLSHQPLEKLVDLETKEERSLALALLSFEGAVRDVAATLEPHRLCTYLYELATTFSGFYNKCPVLKADPATRTSRLILCVLTGRVLREGLALLGISAPARM